MSTLVANDPPRKHAGWFRTHTHWDATHLVLYIGFLAYFAGHAVFVYVNHGEDRSRFITEIAFTVIWIVLGTLPTVWALLLLLFLLTASTMLRPASTPPTPSTSSAHRQALKKRQADKTIPPPMPGPFWFLEKPTTGKQRQKQRVVTPVTKPVTATGKKRLNNIFDWSSSSSSSSLRSRYKLLSRKKK